MSDGIGKLGMGWILARLHLLLFKLILDMLSKYIHDFAFYCGRYAGCSLQNETRRTIQIYLRTLCGRGYLF